MASTYQQYQQQLGTTPFQQPYGQAFLGAFGSIKDYLVSRLKQSVRARFSTLAPPDALSSIGQERGLFRGPTESSTAYALRIQNAWTAWQWAGTAYGILQQLFVAGYPSVYLLSRQRQYTLDVNGNLVTTVLTQAQTYTHGYPNAQTPFWNVFGVAIVHPWPTAWLSSSNWAQQYHVGTDTGALGATGVPSPDVQLAVKIIASGAVGTATFQYATDAVSAAWSSTATLNASQVLGATGVTLTASSHFTAGEYYWLSQAPPGDSSADANLFRAVLSNWKPAHAVCKRIIIQQTGKLIGILPSRNLGASNGIIGGASATYWTPPAN